MNGRSAITPRQNQTWQPQPRKMASQTSRKMIDPTTTQTFMRYQQLQKILINQNHNLKEQNQFLIREIRRVTRKEKALRLELEDKISRNSLQQDYIGRLQEDFGELKNFIRENVERLILQLKTDTLKELKYTLSQFIIDLNQVLCLQLQEVIRLEKQRSRQIKKGGKLVRFSIDSDIEQLKYHLQTPSKQKNSSIKEPTQRRDCNELDKPVYQSNGFKKTPRFSLAKNQGQFAIYSHQTSKNNSKELSSHHKELSSHHKTQYQMQNQQSIIKLYEKTESKSFTERERNHLNGFGDSRQRGTVKNGFGNMKANKYSQK